MILQENMTREEEIRNAVDTTIPILPSNNGRTYEQALMATGFEAGVKWADKNPKSPWISVDDDLPCNHDELMSKYPFGYKKQTVNVLTLLPNGSVATDSMGYRERWWNGGQWDGEKWEWSSLRKPTHWFPIPKLPK